MQPTSTLNYLFYLAFILIPGYVTLQGYLAGNVKLDDLPRTDKILKMVLGGIIVLMISVTVHRLNLPEIAGWILESISAGYLVSWNVVFNPAVQLAPPTGLSVLYAFCILFSQSVIGWPLGWYIGRRSTDANGNRQSYRVLKQPWDEVTTHAAPGDEVTVVTTQNREITGEVEQLGSPSESYDILLAEPEEVYRESNGDIHTRRELGAHSYHHYRDISHIEFEDEFDKEQPPPWKHAPWKTSIKLGKQRLKRGRTYPRQVWEWFADTLNPLEARTRKEVYSEADAVVALPDGQTVSVELKNGEQAVLVRQNNGETDDSDNEEEEENQ